MLPVVVCGRELGWSDVTVENHDLSSNTEARVAHTVKDGVSDRVGVAEQDGEVNDR